MAEVAETATSEKGEVAQYEQTGATTGPPDSQNFDEDNEPYHITWRTIIALLSVSVCFASTTFGITGPNFSIGYMVQTFPAGAKNAVWIADASLLATVTLPNIIGPTSDRYGKKWFMVFGPLISVVGAVIAGSAKNLNTIVGGQAVVGVGSSMTLVAVAVAMEIVPAKYRVLAFAVMAAFNGCLGAIAGPFVFAACVQHNVGGVNGWRWGFYVEAILFGVAMVGTLVSYNPPPTRFRREQSAKELIKSLDFIGIFLLSLGLALVLVGLIWGGQQYPWKSAHVIPMLVVGPLLIIAFGIYGWSLYLLYPNSRITAWLTPHVEWKGRRDGLFHHDFFASRTFPILLCLGSVDGMLLYGLSDFVPNQIRSLYTAEPLGVARIFAFNFGFLPIGYVIIGSLVTKLKKFRLPLIVANLLTTLVLGLLTRAKPDNLGYFEAMLTLTALVTAANTVVPVGGIALVVPSHLLATSNLILAIVRVFGGVLGLTIFNTVYNNKAAVKIPAAIIPILAKAGLPEASNPQLIGIILQAPQALYQVPNLPPALIQQLLRANSYAAADCYKYVWFCIMAVAAACLALSFFIVDVPERMNNQVETALEDSARLKQKQVD